MLKKILLFYFLFCTLHALAQEYEHSYTFFTNSRMQDDYFFSRTEGGSNSFVKNINGRLPVSEDVFHTPGNSLRFEYKNGSTGNWRAVISYENKRGIDFFKKPEFLSFWVYSAGKVDSKSLPQISLLKNDSSYISLGTFNIKKIGVWNNILIPVNGIPGFDPIKLKDYIGIEFSQRVKDNQQCTIYIDDIEFINDARDAIVNKPELISAKGYAKHVDIAWNEVADKNIHLVKIYRSIDGEKFFPVGVQLPYINRYADFTGITGKKYFYKISFMDESYHETNLSIVKSASTRPMTDNELLTMVQEACFRYYWDGAEQNSGMALENIPGRRNMIASGASGFGIMALIVGAERGFVSRKEVVKRFLQIVNFLQKAETFHGAYPHFIDGTTGKVEPFFGKKDNGADLVETSFLLQGLLAARQYLAADNPEEKEIRDNITQIWEKVEWSWFKQRPDSKFLYWHWSPDQAWVINHPLIGWNETMVTYLLAIASPTHPVNAAMYYSGWASQDTIAQHYRKNWGGTIDGSKYFNGNNYYGVNLEVGVSNGGPLFFTHYSYMGYDPHAINDRYTNYFENNRNIALINYKYSVADPNNNGLGPCAWGLTASDGPSDYFADEPIKTREDGKLTPTGAIASMPYLPDESLCALKNYYNNYGKFLWGEYGFKDAVNLKKNWCSGIYMGLNQAPMVVMMENYRTGLIWKLFMSNTDIQNGLKKLELETKNNN